MVSNKRRVIYIFDEAHNIESVCRDSASFSFSVQQLLSASDNFELCARLVLLFLVPCLLFVVPCFVVCCFVVLFSLLYFVSASDNFELCARLVLLFLVPCFVVLFSLLYFVSASDNFELCARLVLLFLVPCLLFCCFVFSVILCECVR
jgi:hypothetical protein